MEELKAQIQLLLDIIEKLQQENAELKKIVAQQAARIAELEKRLGLNSNNSSKPPSSDGFKKKTKSLRINGKNPSGGQNGHEGTTLKQVTSPDKVINHEINTCPHCQGLLSEQVVGVVKRQVFDIPLSKIEVTEHRAEIKICPCCKHKVQAEFPSGIVVPTQYGPRVKALAVYLNDQHFIPEDRLQMLFKDMYNTQIATATLVKFCDDLSTNLDKFDESVLSKIKIEARKHLDETGFRVGGKTGWLHVASNAKYTYYHYSAKRLSLLTGLAGVIVHDDWRPYLNINGVEHAMRHAHHLRELNALVEYEKEKWAKKMRRLLLFMNKYRDLCDGKIPTEKIIRLEALYDDIIEEGLKYHLAFRESLLSGKIPITNKKQAGHNLLLRLKNHRVSALRFLHDPNVPFTNNQAEQDLRMMKIRQKISGGFRTIEGAKVFIRIRTFISTARKQGWNVFESLTRAILGNVPLIAV